MNETRGPIKVLCVDDSALVRRLLTEIVEAEPDMTMVATAPDPLVARELIKRHNPHVLTLDVEMPRMDGLDFLARLMRLRPMPVVMVSTLTERGSETTLKALELGAVDFVAKPQFRGGTDLADYAGLVAERIRAAASARPRISRTAQAGSARPDVARAHPDTLFVVGASTGGTEALRELLVPMPASAPPILVTQHMPAGFTASFARRLDSLCRIKVLEAEHGQPVMRGHAYIAPGGEHHMSVAKRNGRYVIELHAGPPVNRHRPAVDVLFQSALSAAGARAIGILLTGMGQDGARGLLALREAGARTLAQDEATCVVFGMPRAAIALGAAQHIVPIDAMCATAVSLLERAPGRQA
jgi:two-component system chemotaxis response regulator CheB